jgi:anti-anti-sigma factor
MPEQSADNEELTSAELDIQQRRDRDGWLTLALVGELDLSSVGRLETRLRQLRHESYRVRLDLSELRFIDSRGLQVIILALKEARETGWELDVWHELAPAVQSVVEMSGTTAVLWPREAD